MAKAKVGDRIQLTPVAATVTDANGTYRFTEKSVSSTLRTIGSPYQEVVVPSLKESGLAIVNILSDQTTSQSGFGAAPAAAGGSTSDYSSAAFSGVVVGNGDISLSSAPATAAVLEAEVLGTDFAKASDYGECWGITCAYSTLTKKWNQHTGIGQVQSKTANANAQFIYQKGSTSTLGIGVSASGKAGSYSQSATTTAKSSMKIEFGEKKGIHNVYYRTDFVYGKYKDEIYVGPWRTSLKYRLAPTGAFAGGNYSYNVSGTLKSKNPAQYCTVYKKGDKVTKDTTKAMTWTDGVTIGSSDINAKLSSVTGYDTNTSVKFSFTGGAYLCGINSAPGGSSPGLLYASPSKS
jgi:hypothetical protein